MTLKEAKEILNTAKEIVQTWTWDENETIDNTLGQKFNDLLFQLKRETPIKPEVINKAVIYRCPKCGEYLRKDQKQCYSCWQVVDWRGIK